MRRFFTNPFAVLILAGMFLVFLFIGAVLPQDFMLGQVLRFLAVAFLVAALLPVQAFAVWRIRGVWFKIKNGVPEFLSTESTADLTGKLYMALALSNCAAALLIRI